MASHSYIIPPQLRKSDYTKGALTQDEYLKIAIANDANIAQARKSFKQGTIPQLTPLQSATPDELLIDLSKQQSDARNNLLRLGFRDTEARDITTALINEPDVLQMFNLNYPAIESDIKKRFNIKLLTPTFFLEYLKSYFENIKASKGLDVNSSALIRNPLNAMINSIDELKLLMPDPNVIDYIRKSVKANRAVSKEAVDKLDDLKSVLLTSQQFNALGQQQAGTNQYTIIQDMLNTLKDIPTRAEVEELAKKVSQGLTLDLVNEINSLADSVPSKADIEDLIKQYRDSGIPQATGIAQSPQLQTQPTPAKSVPVITSIDEWRNLSSEQKKDFLRFNNLIKDKLTMLIGKTSTGAPLEQEISTYSELKKNVKASDWDRTNAEQLVQEWLQQKPPAQEVPIIAQPTGQTQVFGSGIKTVPYKRRIMLGKGIALEEKPTYRQFGKFAIHIPQLEQEDVLNVKYQSLGSHPKYRPTAVSDIFRDFILDVLDGKRPNERVYLQIEPKERKLFEDIAIGAGVWNNLGLKRTTTNEEEEDLKRFELLKGIYMAGNNAPQVTAELRKLVTKFINNGRMKRQIGLNLLMELSV